MIENEAAYEAAVRRNIRNNARKTFMKRERAQEVVNWVYSARGEFAASLAQSLENYGKLTDRQFAAVLKCIDNGAARKAEWEAKRQEIAAQSGFVGTEGAKIALKGVKIEKILTVSAPRFSYYDRDSQEIFLMRDADGNRIVYRTKALQFFKGTEVEVKEGAVVNLTAKVKSHTEFRGEKQTQVSYIKFEAA